MSQLTTYLRRMWRASLTPASLLTLDEVVEAVPAPGPAARQWVEQTITPVGELAGLPLYMWADVMAALCGRKGIAEDARGKDSTDLLPRPITTWKSAAEVLGISEDTLARRRRERDPDHPCYFAGVEALRTWWEALIVPRARVVAPGRPRRRGVPAKADVSVDWGELARALTEEHS